jgi:hypothetical protein
MNIEFWNGGWYVVNGPDPMELRKGPYLTFQEAYDILDQMKQQPKPNGD